MMTLFYHKNNNILIRGDIVIKLMHKGTLSSSQICTVYLNTSFIFKKTLRFTIKDCDPSKIRYDKRFKDDFWVILKTAKTCKKWTPKTPISKICESCQQAMKNEFKRWISLNDLLDYHKYINKDQLTSEGAGKFLFNDSLSNRFNEVVRENEKKRRQTFRWSNNAEEWRFLWNLSDLDQESSSESEEQNDEEGFFNSVFKHNLKNEITRPKRGKVNLSMGNDEKEGAQKIEFIFDSDNEDSIDLTSKRRNQNRNLFSVEEFLEFSKEDKVKDICDESEDFFDLVYNHFEELELIDNNEITYTNSESTDSFKQNSIPSRLSIVELYNLKQSSQKSSIESTNINEFNHFEGERELLNTSISSDSKLKIIKRKVN